MKKFFIIGFLCLTTTFSWSQENWALLRDLNESWFYFDENWQPVTDRYDEYKAIYFKLNEATFNGKYLIIRYPGRFAIFLNEQIINVAKDSIIFSLDSLSQKHPISDNALFSIHADDLQASNLRTHLMGRYLAADEPEVDVINIPLREQKIYTSFYGILFLAIMLVLVLFKTFYPKNFINFYSMRKVFSTRDIEESMLRGRLFSRINLLIMIFQSFIIGLFISLFVVHIDTFMDQNYRTVFDYLTLWVNLSLIVAAFIFIKFILIRNFTSLYDIGNFSTPHFMSYLRFVSLIFGSALVIFYLGIFGMEWQTPSPFLIVIDIVLILLGLGIILIYLKLITATSYKILHLFSYLCATEILPYVVILKLAINHSI